VGSVNNLSLFHPFGHPICIQVQEAT
jgi:hypothetical protein